MSAYRENRDAGFALVEVLVALTILALAAAGAMGVISNALSRQEAIRLQSVMLTELGYRLDLGREGQGELVDEKTGRRGAWSVDRELVRTGQLAGVEVRWERVDATIIWHARGADMQQTLSRVEIIPSAASASSRP